MAAQCDGFEAERNTLRGNLKVLRLPSMPSALSPDAVHLVPGSGGIAAFFEPTARGEACALISWASSEDKQATAPTVDAAPAGTADLASVSDADQARRLLAASLPLVAAELNTTEIGEQFVSQRVSKASTVRCNTYHFGRAVLLGDAAHSTGGASGQGCNSALADAVALADALERCAGNVEEALPAYSRERVPEGCALLDLSVGPPRDASPIRRLVYALSSGLDFLLGPFGLREPPLQTLLTTSLQPFAEIRRRRTASLGSFPTDEEFAEQIERASS